MDDLDLLIDLHRDGPRQGPGSAAHTRSAMGLAGLDDTSPLRIADLGCGTGASTLVLAEDLDADIVAVDLVPEFLEVLERTAERHGVADRITTSAESMDALPFADAEFDVLWSEGAVYSIGFEAGVTAWRRFLKPGGVLVVSELTWFTAERPAEIEDHWRAEYPEIDLASAKIGILERAGYAPLGYFTLPGDCWTDEYYAPLRARFTDFLARHPGNAAAATIVAAEEREIALYDRYGAYYGYGVYVARVPEA